MTGRRWTMIIGGLLATGAAVGAASALIKRRKSSQNHWEEYGTRTTTGTGASMIDTSRSTMDAGVDKVSSAAEAAKDRASDLIGASSSDLSGNSTRDLKQQRDDLYGKPAQTSSPATASSGISRNSRP